MKVYIYISSAAVTIKEVSWTGFPRNLALFWSVVEVSPRNCLASRIYTLYSHKRLEFVGLSFNSFWALRIASYVPRWWQDGKYFPSRPFLYLFFILASCLWENVHVLINANDPGSAKFNDLHLNHRCSRNIDDTSRGPQMIPWKSVK